MSTRTTHPYFLKKMQDVMDIVGLPVTLINRYRFKTKGEMLRDCSKPDILRKYVDKTVSCGKWKRKWKQCGRCVPCTIRRASIYAAGLPDGYSYQSDSLLRDIQNENVRDDLFALISACLRNKDTQNKCIVSSNGPLNASHSDVEEYFNVYKRGLSEILEYLKFQGVSI
jgi:hypothetical protein